MTTSPPENHGCKPPQGSGRGSRCLARNTPRPSASNNSNTDESRCPWTCSDCTPPGRSSSRTRARHGRSNPRSAHGCTRRGRPPARRRRSCTRPSRCGHGPARSAPGPPSSRTCGCRCGRSSQLLPRKGRATKRTRRGYKSEQSQASAQLRLMSGPCLRRTTCTESRYPRHARSPSQCSRSRTRESAGCNNPRELARQSSPERMNCNHSSKCDLDRRTYPRQCYNRICGRCGHSSPTALQNRLYRQRKMCTGQTKRVQRCTLSWCYRMSTDV
mmetsp:Transcript_30429/g.86925  ORF Transcript_30429/g.86925 Transcript_30429/m.86925 type:complete len:272 (+) Transcript_30429:690-1505(+)